MLDRYAVESYKSYGAYRDTCKDIEYGRDVGARCDALGVDSGHFLVPVSEGDEYGFSKNRQVIMSEEVVGQESSIVSLDVMHHLHCLDILRIAL
ncbi:hypothetical protein BST61_g2846 [Cercospora zeina]